MRPTEAPLPPAPPARPVLVPPDGARALDAFGDHVELLLSGADTGGALALFVTTTPPGGGPPPHVHHRESEVFFVLEGTMEFFAEGQWTRVAPGGAAFLPRGVPHTFRNAGPTPCRALTMALPGGFEQFFASCAAVFAAAPGAPPDIRAIEHAAAAHGIEFLVPLDGPAPGGA